MDLDRYIAQQAGAGELDSVFSASGEAGEIFSESALAPLSQPAPLTFSGDTSAQLTFPAPAPPQTFSVQHPVYYDVPIKIEETGEGFDPPSEIR